MDSLNALVAKWRTEHDAGGHPVLCQCADELETALADEHRKARPGVKMVTLTQRTVNALEAAAAFFRSELAEFKRKGDTAGIKSAARDLAEINLMLAEAENNHTDG